MPALIKNALEWVVSSGELVGKPVLAMTFTPKEPRGEKAMQSLTWSLQALDSRVVGQLALYQNEVKIKAGKIVADVDNLEMLREAIDLL
jgi:chromate reductase